MAAPDRLRFTLRTSVNGQAFAAEIEPREMLLDFLRNRLGLTGAKRSCDMQVCGACTVLVDGAPVSACCTLAYEVRGRDVLTIEGLARGEALHPLQTAFMRRAAVQCGFCTAGMILAAKHILEVNPQPTRAELQHALKGNLCRCTGYWSILEAIEEAAQALAAGAVEAA